MARGGKWFGFQFGGGVKRGDLIGGGVLWFAHFTPNGVGIGVGFVDARGGQTRGRGTFEGQHAAPSLRDRLAGLLRNQWGSAGSGGLDATTRAVALLVPSEATRPGTK